MVYNVTSQTGTQLQKMRFDKFFKKIFLLVMPKYREKRNFILGSFSEEGEKQKKKKKKKKKNVSENIG